MLKHISEYNSTTWLKSRVLLPIAAKASVNMYYRLYINALQKRIGRVVLYIVVWWEGNTSVATYTPIHFVARVFVVRDAHTRSHPTCVCVISQCRLPWWYAYLQNVILTSPHHRIVCRLRQSTRVIFVWIVLGWLLYSIAIPRDPKLWLLFVLFPLPMSLTKKMPTMCVVGVLGRHRERFGFWIAMRCCVSI